MTTAAQPQPYSESKLFTGSVLLALVIIVSVSLVVLRDTQTPTLLAIKAIPKIQYQPHSVQRHGEDALAIRQCLNDKGGADEIWRSFDKKTFYLWCQLPDGIWGFMAIVQDVIDRLWYESTSFIKGDGTRDALLNYMRKFGTRFNGPFPWE